MKKLLGILVLGLLLSGNAYSKVGKGNFQMNEDVLEYFIEYLRHEYATSFVVSKDGNFSTYGICGAKVCSGGSGGTSTLLKYCKRETGNKCYIFAQRKNKKKIIRWNKVDYIFPSEEWNYNEMVKAEHLKSDNEGIKKNISDNDIIDILNNFGFISGNISINETKLKKVANTDTNSKTEETKAKGNYYCIWYDEYFAVYRFTHNKISPETCADRELFIVKEFEHKKLYNSLKWKFRKVKEGDDPVVKVPKKLFLKIEKQIPKLKKIDNKAVVKNEKIQKKETTKKIEKKTTTTSISPKLKLIEDMYKSGALTKNEYEAAKKRATE
ncbi:MAG: hypothetical protein H8E55_11290 [Pelagibacterales bacterium]|nr:hypothetical protein [Pelagibacterales bacterium]